SLTLRVGRQVRLRDSESRATVLLGLGRIDRAAVHSHTDGAVVPGCHLGDELHLFLPGLLSLVMVEMAGVVADFVHVRRHPRRESIVFLQIDRQIGPWSSYACLCLSTAARASPDFA